MYATEVDGQKLTMQVSGKLWMRSLIMSDLETRTEWSHLLGEAMAGELKGKKLEVILTDMVTWGVWKQQHPETTVMDLSATSKNYTANFYNTDQQFLFGFLIDHQPWALPLEVIQAEPVLPFECNQRPLLATWDETGTVVHLFDRTLGETTLSFRKAGDQIMEDETGSQWEMLNGLCISGKHKGKSLKPLPGIMSFREAWSNFHPDSNDVES